MEKFFAHHGTAGTKFCEKSIRWTQRFGKPSPKKGNSNPRVAKCWQSRGWNKSCGNCFVKLRNSLKPSLRLPSIHFFWRPQRFFWGATLRDKHGLTGMWSFKQLIPGDTVHVTKIHVGGQHHVLRFQEMNAYIYVESQWFKQLISPKVSTLEVFCWFTQFLWYDITFNPSGFF